MYIYANHLVTEITHMPVSTCVCVEIFPDQSDIMQSLLHGLDRVDDVVVRQNIMNHQHYYHSCAEHGSLYQMSWQ